MFKEKKPGKKTKNKGNKKKKRKQKTKSSASKWSFVKSVKPFGKSYQIVRKKIEEIMDIK